MSVESKDDNKQGIRELLEEKEAMIAHGQNGRMGVRRPRKSKTDKEKLEEALKRVKKKLGVEETNALKAKWDGLSTGRGEKDRLVGNGLISSKLQLGLSYL